MNTPLDRVLANPLEFWSKFVQPRVSHIQNVSPLGSKDPVRDARRTLDAELLAMHLAMCNLRTRRNALSPISSLPPEVLARIFKFLAIDPPPEMAPWSSVAPSTDRPASSQLRLGWISVTHVCRHWRNSALLRPRLWGTINYHLTQHWREAMIARAKSAPLSIHLPYHPRENSLLAQHANHTRVLKLSATAHRLEQAFHSLTESPATVLEWLELRDTYGPPVILPANVFAGQTPSLRHVILDGISFPWSSPIFCNLTHLRVALSCNAPVSEEARPDESAQISQYDHLLGALARMPALQTLELAHCIPSTHHHPPGDAFVFLPRLESLSLAGMFTDCVDFISRLCIPSSSRIALEFTGKLQKTDGLVRFLGAHTSESSDFLTLCVTNCKKPSNPSLCMELWRECSSTKMNEPDFRPKSEPPVSIRLPRSADSLALLERLCGALPLEDLRILEFTYNFAEWSPETWVNVFGRCKRVEHVFIGGWNAAHFCKTLTYAVYKGFGEALRSRDLFFRNLRSLEVYGLNLFSLIEHEKINCRVIEVLQSQLRAREDMMYDDSDNEEECSESEDGDASGDFDPRLDQLRISECSVRRFYVEDMKDVVADVVWDEFEGIYGKGHNEREDWAR